MTCLIPEIIMAPSDPTHRMREYLKGEKWGPVPLLVPAWVQGS